MELFFFHSIKYYELLLHSQPSHLGLKNNYKNEKNGKKLGNVKNSYYKSRKQNKIKCA